MFGSPFENGSAQKSSTPTYFKDNARNAIYKQLPVITSNTAQSIRSAPSQFLHGRQQSSSHRSISSSSSIFSSITGGKRSVRSAPSIYSSSTATIPEDSEPVSTTVEQLVNDTVLHENHYKAVAEQNNINNNNQNLDFEEMYKISLGSDLQYQNVPESLIDWNLNVTRCKLILTQLPQITSTDIPYNQNALPQLIGDLATVCHIILIQPHISDKELIYTLFSSNLYQEHNLDVNFKKSVAEISVKQSRLLQINNGAGSSTINPEHSFLKFKFKEIAIRNYLINLAAAATTAHEYKLKMDEVRAVLKMQQPGKKVKLTKEEKKTLWEQVRSDVFRRAGL
ncbi:MTH1 Protein MTH1 [Candida maltosa Xu316]